MHSNNKPSPKWAKLCEALFCRSDGKHCHWCKYITFNDYGAFCFHKDSKFFNDTSIGTFDGYEYPIECGVFELSDFYQDDDNYEKAFAREDC